MSGPRDVKADDVPQSGRAQPLEKGSLAGKTLEPAKPPTERTPSDRDKGEDRSRPSEKRDLSINAERGSMLERGIVSPLSPTERGSRVEGKGEEKKEAGPSPTLKSVPAPKSPEPVEGKTKQGWLKCSQRSHGGFFTPKRKECTAFHVATHGVLTFYGSDSKLDPLGSLPLADGCVEVVTREDHNILNLRGMGHPLVHTMECATLAERAEWLEVFRSQGVTVRTALLEDYMWKTGSKMLKWHRRKFVMYEDSLDYFKTDTDDTPAGTIPVLPGLIAKDAPSVGNIGDSDEVPFTFCVSYKSSAEDRQYHINAVSKDQRERWVNLLREVVATEPAKKCHKSVHEGYLYKATGRDCWQRMYSVLYDSELAFYKSKYDGVPAFSIPLHVTAEANLADKGALSTFVLWEKGDEGSKTHLIRAFDDNASAAWIKAINTHFSEKLVKKHPDSLKEGYLILCPPPDSTGIFDGNRRHYFVLARHALQYYKRRDDPKPAGEVAISGNAFVYLEQGVLERPVFSCASTGDEGAKKTYMQTKDAAQRVEWVNCLIEHIKTMRNKKVEDSVLEGYMFLVSVTGLKIMKRFFVLTQNSLDWYKKRTDTTRAGWVDLLPESEAALEDDEKGEFLFSVASSGDEGSKKTSISCYTEQEQNKWVQSINDIIEAKNVKVNPSSLKEGYLWKDNSSHNYNKRYFVLLEDRMLYYAKRKDAADSGKEKGSILLPGGTRLDRHPEVKNPKRGRVFPFSLTPSGDEGARIYGLEACSSKGREAWIGTILSVTATKQSAVNSFSVMEGYLSKSDGKGKNWHKRYCVLWPDKLLYYKQKPVGDIEDLKESGQIDISYDSSIQACPEPKFPYMFQVSPAGDETSRRYFMQADDEPTMNKWLDAIGALIAKRPQEKRDPETTMEDYLAVQGSGGVWKKRYCCLYSDRVVMYQSKVDKKDLQLIELTANTIVLMQDPKLGVFYLTSDVLCRTNETKRAETWVAALCRACSKLKKWPLFGGTLNDGLYISPRKVPLLCYEIVMHLLPKVTELTNFQKSGDREVVASIQAQYEEGKKVDLTPYASIDVLNVLILYLKETGNKQSLIGNRILADLEKFLKPKNFLEEDVPEIRAVLMKLDDHRLLLTRWILYFLHRVASSESRMTAELISMRFAPVMMDTGATPREETVDRTRASSSAAPASPPMGHRVQESINRKLAPVSPLRKGDREDKDGEADPAIAEEQTSKRPNALTVQTPGSNRVTRSPSPASFTFRTGGGDSGEQDGELFVPQGRTVRGASIGTQEHASKLENCQRVVANLIEKYDLLFPGGIPKTYRPRGQQLHYWTQITDDSGKVVYLNMQTGVRQSEVPGPFKTNPAEWTFADILAHKAGLDRMHAYALNQHNAENLEFYLAVKEYRSREVDTKDENSESLADSAMALYNKFVKSGTVCEVNIGNKMKAPLDAIFGSGAPEPFLALSPEQQREVFSEASAEIYRLVEQNDFRNYVKSQDFKDHLAALAETLT